MAVLAEHYAATDFLPEILFGSQRIRGNSKSLLFYMVKIEAANLHFPTVYAPIFLKRVDPCIASFALLFLPGGVMVSSIRAHVYMISYTP